MKYSQAGSGQDAHDVRNWSMVAGHQFCPSGIIDNDDGLEGGLRQEVLLLKRGQNNQTVD